VSATPEPAEALERNERDRRRVRALALISPLLVLAFALVRQWPLLEAEVAELPTWQAVLLLSSDGLLVLSYALWIPQALRARSGRAPPETHPALRVTATLVLLLAMFAPDLAVSVWLSVEHAHARERSVETAGTVVRIEEVPTRMRLARYEFRDRAGALRRGTLRFPKVPNSRSIDLELLASLEGPVPFDVRLRYDPEHPETSWLLGQHQSLSGLPELSALVLALQVLFVAIVALGPKPAMEAISHSERIKAVPVLVLAGVHLMGALR
jgi:hypothetical protein